MKKTVWPTRKMNMDLRLFTCFPERSKGSVGQCSLVMKADWDHLKEADDMKVQVGTDFSTFFIKKEIWGFFFLKNKALIFLGDFAHSHWTDSGWVTVQTPWCVDFQMTRKCPKKVYACTQVRSGLSSFLACYLGQVMWLLCVSVFLCVKLRSKGSP